MSEILDHIKTFQNENLAIVDENNKVSYNAMFNEIEQLKNQINNYTENNKARILLSGKNSTSFVLLLLAFLDLDIEIILVDTKTALSEIEMLVEYVEPNFIVSEVDLFKNVFNTDHKIKATQTSFSFYKFTDDEINYNDERLFFCSSGSTGKQKIFGFTQAQILDQFLNIANYLQFTEKDQSLCPLTITHSHGLMISIPILLKGGCVHYLSPKNCTPENILKYVAANNITLLTGVPYQYNLMLNADVKSDIQLQTLRYCFCGSAPMSTFLANAFHQKFGVRLNQVYGLSEIGPICFNLDTTDENYVSVGKVIPNIEYKILNENDNKLNENNEGELLVKASFMCNRYINNRSESQLTFIDNWLYTNDIVKIDEQKNIYIIGRKSNFINIAGYKVYPIEIEKTLLGLKGIKEAVVVGVEDENKGQLIKAIITVFFPLKEDEISVFCKEHLAIYKIPHIIQIVESLEHTSIGKIQLSSYKNNKS